MTPVKPKKQKPTKYVVEVALTPPHDLVLNKRQVREAIDAALTRYLVEINELGWYGIPWVKTTVRSVDID